MDINTIQKVAEDKIDLITNTSIEVMELIAKAAWNEAIEAAAVMLETTNLNDKDDSEEVRKLKK